MSTWTHEQVLKDVTTVVAEMIQDFDSGFSGTIGPDSKLVGDLDFQSTDVVELVGAIETKFKRRKLPFHKLVLKDGKYSDFTVGQLADFLVAQLNAPQAS